MAYNFKSIADVEVVAEPAESANVLIEEDGVIKKAPKTAVGGSALMIVFDDYKYNEEYGGYEIISAPNNLYEIIKEMYQNFTHVNITGCNIGGQDESGIRYYQLQRIWDQGEYYMIELGYYGANVYPNGTISVYYND